MAGRVDGLHSVKVAGCFLRLATPADVPHIVSLIRGLAEYEKLLDECHATEEKMHQALFSTERQPYEVTCWRTAVRLNCLRGTQEGCLDGTCVLLEIESTRLFGLH